MLLFLHEENLIMASVRLSLLIAFGLCVSFAWAPFGLASEPPCTVPASWLSGAVPKPEPGKFESSSNCEFHQIAWHYFLWLTEEVGEGTLRFQTLFSEEALAPETPNAKNEDLHLVFQAGSLGILVDQSGRATYTEIFINDVYRDFVQHNKLYDPDVLKNFDSKTTFPVGSLSLKASWKLLENGEAPKGRYTTRADVRKLATQDGKIVILPKGEVQKNVPVALVGLHIAIVVEGHPEAIWATFEHVDNAPNMYAGQTMDAEISERDYTFYKAKTLAKDVNQNNAPIIRLDAATQLLSPVTQVARQYPYGGGSSSNQNNIASINQSVAAGMTSSVWKNYMEVGAVWLLGEVVDNVLVPKENVLVPNWSPKVKTSPSITGSTTLSSSVIETFTQNVSSQNDCFSCHNTMALTDVPADRSILPGKNVSTSHVLLQRYVQGLPVNR
jgi:hypothetical protein